MYLYWYFSHTDKHYIHSSSQCNVIASQVWLQTGLSHLKISIHEMWRLPTNFPLSYNLLPCLSLTRSRRAWMEEWFCPSHCLICLGKALTSNTNLNDSIGNLGSVSEARLGLAQWPSLREHRKFAGSICHSRHELRKRTRKEWLNGLDLWLALVDVRWSAALVVLWDYRKLYQTLSLIMDASNFTKEKKE